MDAMKIQSMLRNDGPGMTTRAQAQRVASQFESMFVQQIVSKMREGSDLMGENSMFGSGPGSNTYATWFDTYMSEHMAKSGRVGVADALMRQFEDLGQIIPEANQAGEGKASNDERESRLDQTV